MWVAELLVSDAVAAKVAGRHGIDVAELRAALGDLRGIAGRWDDDLDRGRRVYAELEVGGATVRAVLYPVESTHGDTWALASAYRFGS